MDHEENYIAVNQDATLYTTLKNRDGCTNTRDTAVYNSINILNKTRTGEIAYAIYLIVIMNLLQKL